MGPGRFSPGLYGDDIEVGHQEDGGQGWVGAFPGVEEAVLFDDLFLEGGVGCGKGLFEVGVQGEECFFIELGGVLVGDGLELDCL